MLILPQRDGEVVVHEGYLPLKEARRLARQAADEAGADPDESEAPKPARSETTQALQNYVALHKAAAVRLALAQNPLVALRLAVACLIGGAANGSVRADRTAPHGPAVAASVEAGAASAAFRDERATVWRWLAGDAKPADAALSGRGHGERHTAETFGRLSELSDAQVLKVLAVIAAEALVAGGGLAERLGERLQIDMRRFWQPDETFLDLLTDKAALAGIAAEVGAVPSAKATGKELRAADSPPPERRRVSAGRELVAALLRVPDPRLHRAARVGGPRRLRQAGAARGRRGSRRRGRHRGRNRIRGHGRRRNRRGRRVGRGRLIRRAGGEPPARCATGDRRP